VTTTSPPPPPGGTIKVGVEDEVRRRVMYITIGIFAVTVAAACLGGFWLDNPNAERVMKQAIGDDRKLAKELAEVPFDHLKQILQILLPAETALLGSATGFYFGAKAKES
jgi:hypothetical protein